jgi:hypothetical protein
MRIVFLTRRLVLVVNITLFSLWNYVAASAAFLHRPTATAPPSLLHRQTTKHHLNHRPSLSSTSLSSSSSSKQNAYIAFPGGGLFFYWQAGVLVSAFCFIQYENPESDISPTPTYLPSFCCTILILCSQCVIKLYVKAYLQEEGYNLSEANLSGASAGALSATLAKMNVCPLRATELALSLSEDANVWERPLGLQGVWGKLIYEWLDQLVPEDAEERVAQGGGEVRLVH